MKLILANWHVLRIVRLVLGVIFLVQTFKNPDLLSGFIAIFLLYQAATNTGCGFGQPCATKPTNNGDNKTNEITFEEIKSK